MAFGVTLRILCGVCLCVLFLGHSGITGAPEGGGRTARGEEEEASLADMSAQIIREQDAEEGQIIQTAVKTDAPENSDTLCLKPRVPENGYIEGTNFEDGGQVHVRCNKTYKLIGPSELTCIPIPYPGAKHGIWLPEDIYTCIKDSNNSLCFIPDPPANGYIEGTDFDDGGKVQVMCNEGYTLRGPSQIMCVPVSVPNATHGVWIPQDKYTCTKSDTRNTLCTMPEAPTNGYIEGQDSDLDFGGKVRVRCEEGYTLVGPSVLTCKTVPYPGVRQGWWQPQDPYACRPEHNPEETNYVPEDDSKEDSVQNIQLGESSFCEEPSPPDNGYIEGTNFDLGGKVHVRCETGYTLNGPSELTCEAVPCQNCGHGLWAPQNEYTCTRTATDIQSNMVEVHPLFSDDEAGPSYTVLRRESNSIYPAPGKLGGYQDVQCPPPHPPAHGHLEGTDYSLYATVYITCDPGYTLIGQDSITCLPVPDPFRHIGIWEPQEMPTCKADPPSLLPADLMEDTSQVRLPLRNRVPVSEPNSSQVEGLPSICSLPKVVGPCKAAFPRFYFDKEHMECLPFTYGGCRGNENNFEAFEECQHACR